MLKLKDEIGRGQERICFLHPDEEMKVVKVVHGPNSKQMDREVAIYKQLARNSDITYKHMPKFYNAVETDQGTGYIFDFVKNEDGSNAKTLHWYIQYTDATLESFMPQLEILKAYLLEHVIIFCNDMGFEGNILVRKSNDGSDTLMIIDGLGEVVLIQWLNRVDFLAKRKIERRWDRLMERLKAFDLNCKKQIS